LWQSFHYAARGLRVAFQSQRTMRVHVVLAAGVMVAAVWLDLPPAQGAVLVLCAAAVLAAELTNTAVETVVDLLIGGSHHELAGRAKDLSAAAVLVVAAAALVAGLLVLGPPVIAATAGGGLDALDLARAATLLLILALVLVVARGARRPRP
jgi:diacylglycerol kinase (ATP)